MKVINVADIKGTDREVNCPYGGFVSNRILLESDNIGYTLTKTEIPKGDWQHWHYKYHIETCYCIEGKGILVNKQTKESFDIYPGIVYVLDKNDFHKFKATEDVVLICVFNPPLKGSEVHRFDGSYAPLT